MLRRIIGDGSDCGGNSIENIPEVFFFPANVFSRCCCANRFSVNLTLFRPKNLAAEGIMTGTRGLFSCTAIIKWNFLLVKMDCVCVCVRMSEAHLWFKDERTMKKIALLSGCSNRPLNLFKVSFLCDRINHVSHGVYSYIQVLCISSSQISEREENSPEDSSSLSCHSLLLSPFPLVLPSSLLPWKSCQVVQLLSKIHIWLNVLSGAILRNHRYLIGDEGFYI